MRKQPYLRLARYHSLAVSLVVPLVVVHLPDVRLLMYVKQQCLFDLMTAAAAALCELTAPSADDDDDFGDFSTADAPTPQVSTLHW